MRLALSVRIAEAPRSKEAIAIPFGRLARRAKAARFEGLSIRPSVLAVGASAERIAGIRNTLETHGLVASMVTGALSLATNDAAAPAALRDIEPHLELARALGATRVRVMLHEAADIPHARRAAGAAHALGVTLCHQIHWGSLCETVEEALRTARAIASPSFALTFEPANLLAATGDPGIEALPRLAPHLANVYYQNLALDPAATTVFPTRARGPVGVRFLPLGDPAGIDPAPTLRELRAIDYQGWLTVHQPLLPGEAVEDAVAKAGRLFQAQLTAR